MANNSPTIVSASLSDDQLKKSIDSLVAHVDEAMKKMVQSTNNAVEEMEAKLRSLGSLKIDSGGTNDGGAGRRTQQHEKLTKAVNDASEAVSKETQKLQDLQQSLSGASDREQNFISQKERAANTIAQENELLSKQQSELAALKAQEQQLVDAHQRDMQSRQQNAAAIEKQRGAVKYYEEELSSLQARLTSAQAKIDRFYEVQAKARESISSRLHAPSDQFIGYNDYERGKSVYSKTEQDVRSLIKALSELDNADKKHGFGDELRRAYMNFTPSQDMANVFKRQQEEISSYIKTLQEAKKGTKGETRANLDNQILAGKELLAIYKELGNAQNALNKTVQKEGLRDGGNVGGIKRDIEETQKAYGIAKQKLDELTQSSQKSNQIRQESLNVAAKIQEKEKEISETRGRIAAAKKEQTEADKNASQAAKEKANMQSQVANQEKQVAEAKKQLTTATQQHTDAETKSSRATKEKATTLDQMAAAQQKVARSQSDRTLIKSFNRDELQRYIDRLRELQAEYIKVNTQEGGGAKSDKIKADIRSLEELISKYREILKNLDYVSSRQGTIDVKKWVQDLGAVDDRYKKLKRWYTVLEKEDQRRIASEEKANQKRLADLEKEKAAQEKVIKSYQDSILKAEFGKVMKMPTTNIDEIRAKFERLRTIIANIRELGILSPEKISSADAEVKKLGDSIQRYEKFEQERIAAEQKFIVEQAKEVEQTQTLEGRVKGLAQAAREYFKQNADTRWSTSAYGKGLTIYEENDARAKGLSVEEQIRRQLEAEQQVIQQQVSTSQQLNNERKKYVSPTINDDIYQITRNAIARKLGIDTSKVINADAQYDSIKRVNNALKQLQDAYTRMSNEERNSPIGKQTIRQMQELERQTQRLRTQMSRPISLKDAMGLSEKTLDDIAYKMRQLASYRSGLNASTQVREITQVNDEYNRLKKRMDEVMQKNQQMIASNTALGRSWNYMKNRLAFYFTIGASTQFVKSLIEVRSQYEMNERALGILINSAERGTQIFNELSQMALVSPYTLIELSSAAKQLTAYDIAAKDVVNTTRRLADMAAAVGIPIERLTYALGQVKAYGYLNARDARMFANAGIPLVKNLSEYYTELEGRLVSTADIYDRIKKKQIGYEEVMSTISKMTDEGGKFFDFQAKMAETLKVQLANLTLAWNNMLNDMGEESQGVIVGGIGALKQMFLHWKDIEHVLTELVVTLGAYKAYQLMTTRLIGATSASLDAQILAMKRNNAAMLKKQALTRKLTVDELGQVAAQNHVTAADYRNALSGKNLTKQKALLLVALNKNNVQLKAAIVNMGLLTAQEAANVTTGRALAIVFKSIGISIRNAAMAMKAFMVSNWWILALGGIYELYHAWDSYNEHVAEINRSAAEHAKEAFENIKTYLEGDVINTLRETLKQGGKVSSDAEGQKAWDEMREKIELSSSASNVFIARLMQIDDINERLSAGFGYLEDIQRVAGVMQTLGDDAIKVSTTTLGGLFGEGLKDDLQDYIKSIDILLTKYGDIAKAREDLEKQAKDSGYIGIANTLFDLSSFINEVRKTTDSLYDVASKEGFSISQQREFFERGISETAQAEQMGIKETRIYRMQAEQEYYLYARMLLEEQLQYQQGEQKAATERRLQELKNEFGANKAMQESFFTWLTEKQDHAVKNMLRGKTQEEIKQGDWLKGTNGKWVEEMARKFSKEYGVSFDDLHRLVMNAKTWSINIPVFFQTIGQPLTDVQRDYEARTGKKFSSNYLIKDAKSQVEILDILKKKQKEVAQEMETARKAGDKYWEDNKQSYKEENDALIADIHAYNALTDAEEKANKKIDRGSKKDPLLDALKHEISLVEKLQGDYDKLTKGSASQAEALDTIRGAYGKTIRLLNAQLGKYGLPQLDISQLITGKDPNKALAHFKQTLDTLVNKGMLTLERSKELEAVVEKFTLSAKTYNLDMITKGLNNELGKLKDEYELAVELDADPELGNVFTEMFKINTSNFPKTIDEYMSRVQQKFDDARKSLNLAAPLNVFTANTEQWYNWGKAVDYSEEQVDNFKKSFDGAVGVAKKWAQDVVKQTQDLQYKLADNNGKIAIEEEKLANLRQRLAQETNEEQRRLLELQIQDQQNAIAKLKEEILQLLPTYQRVFGEVAEHSAYMTRKLAKDYKNMLVEGKNRGLNADNTYSVRDPITLQIARISKDRMGKELKNADKELQKAQSTVKKITEAFTKGEDGVVDWVHGVELVGEELGKLGQFVDVVGNIVDAFGNPNEYNATAEAIHDIATSMQGVATAAQGIGQIASGDYIGGAVSVASGLFSAISTWFDNGDKKILQQIKDSERSVKRLENAYKNLEVAIEEAYGTNVIGAKQAAIANKELQLAELQRQLALEKSRSSKNRDEDRIIELQGQIIDLRNDVKRSSQEIAKDLLGISSVGDAAMNLMNAYIDALRKGEDAQKAFSGSFNEMILNMLKQIWVTKVIGPQLESLVEEMNERIKKRSEKEAKDYESAVNEHARRKDLSDEDIRAELIRDKYQRWIREEWDGSLKMPNKVWKTLYDSITQEQIDAYRKETERKLKEAKRELDKATVPTVDDLDMVAQEGLRLLPNLEAMDDIFKSMLDRYGLMDTDADTSLSALQQGIAGVSEETASAVESYLNGISQQAYLRNDLLTQIRDAVIGLDMDIQSSTLSQMLLQLQQSYAVQMAIQGILEGVLTPNGRSFSVELAS